MALDEELYHLTMAAFEETYPQFLEEFDQPDTPFSRAMHTNICLRNARTVLELDEDTKYKVVRTLEGMLNGMIVDLAADVIRKSRE